MSKLVGSRLHRQVRLVHQGDNRLPEVVAVNALKTKARSTDEGSLGARAAKWLRFGKATSWRCLRPAKSDLKNGGKRGVN
jgi:hypothetical protein